MQVGDREVGYVLERAARTHIAATGADVAETYDRCRAWFATFKRTIEVWVTYNDPRSLIYRRLMAHLSGKTVWREPCDNRALGFAIGAGNGWDELPTREPFWPDLGTEVIVFKYFGMSYEGDQGERTAQRRTLATIMKWE